MTPNTRHTMPTFPCFAGAPLTAFLLAVLPLSTPRSEAMPVVISAQPGAESKTISPLFSGLSMETEQVRPGETGSHYFSPRNTALVATFRQLGLKHLRIGGNTVDDLDMPPTEADIDELFAFAKAAGVKVTYSVNLKKGNPADSARIAKYIYGHYRDLVTGITIGNEPTCFVKQYPQYREQTKAHIDAIRAAAPDAAVNGPAVCIAAGGGEISGDAVWLGKFQDDFQSSVKIEYIGAHAYFGGSAYARVKGEVSPRDPVPLRKAMLSKAWVKKYAEMRTKGFSHAVQTGTPFRLDETNTYYMGGAEAASDSMAAAVWALDYLYWWAAHDAQGINFHNGTTLPFKKGGLPGGATRKPCRYASFLGLPDGGYHVQAVGYGLKAFDLGGHGSLVPLTLAAPDDANVTAYAVKAANGETFLTVINKEIGAPARRIALTRSAALDFNRVEAMSLEVKNNDAAATEGFLIGGAPIRDDGTWDGHWSAVPASGETTTITLPATSAIVLHLIK